MFYGWYVAAGCSILLLVSVGVGYYGLAVFLRPLQQEHGWSNSAVSGATGLFFSVGGISGALAGPVIDRKGPLRLMVAGVLVTGGSIAAIGYVHSLWQLYLDYSVLAAAYGATTGVAVNAIVTRWFVLRRARAMSISSTGISVGGVVLAPLASALISRGGLRLATPLMGAFVVLVALPVIALVIVWDPRQMGLEPDGRAAPKTDGDPSPVLATQWRRWTQREAVRTLAFWAILVSFVLVLTSQTGFVIHQISFLEVRLGSRGAAALALSVTAFGSIVARLVVGTFADAIDKRRLSATLFVIQATAVLLIIHAHGKLVIYGLTLVFGFTIGNVYMMQALLVGEVFGITSFGTVFGLISLASQIGSGLGPVSVGWLADRTGSYAVPFTAIALATYAAAGAVLFVRPARPATPSP